VLGSCHGDGGVGEVRGKPPKLTAADEFELWQCRCAGISVTRLMAMWGLKRRRMQEILAKQREKFGVEQMPANKRHLVRARDVRKVREEPETLERT